MASVDGEVREYESLNAVIVPGVAGNGLVVPLQLAGFRLHRKNRSDEEVVLPFRLAKFFRPRATIAGADINKVGFGIIGHAVPNGAAASHLPPVAGPCFGGFLERRIFERL